MKDEAILDGANRAKAGAIHEGSATHSMRRYAVASVVAFATLIGGCGIFSGDTADKTAGWSAQKLYSEAEDEMGAGGYTAAIKLFETLESRYPFGRYAQQAQMEIAYAQYKDGEKDLAIAAADRFIKQYPNSANADYVYYLKGVINFNDDLGLFSALTRQDLSERDQKAAKESFLSFKELVTRFPASRYTPDARQRMNYIVNSLAQYEVHVARYYYQRGAYLAAINRAQAALADYRDVPALEEALYIMVKSYEALGMTQLRDDAQRVLTSNYPKTEFLANGFRSKEDPWWKVW